MLVSVSMLSLTLLVGGGPDLERGSKPVAMPTSSTPTTHEPVEPPATEICVGDPAPDFAYQGYDGRWMRLHHLLDQGSVLLVFGGNETQLSELERERSALLSLGVIPVAVLDRGRGTARRLAVKLGLGYTVLADARQVIAAQFNSTVSGRVTPGWFVVDEHGKVRGMLRGSLPEQDYPQLCARSLGLAIPGTSLPASR
jgi:peroxiredoxin